MVITIRNTGHIASGGKGCEGRGALREKNIINQELEDRKKKEGGARDCFHGMLRTRVWKAGNLIFC